MFCDKTGAIKLAASLLIQLSLISKYCKVYISFIPLNIDIAPIDSKSLSLKSIYSSLVFLSKTAATSSAAR